MVPLVLLVVGLSACSASTGARGGAAESRRVELGVGESAAIDSCEVRFDHLVSDSRCPEGVTCVWAGDAEVALDLRCGARHHELRLHTNLEPRAVEAEGVHIELEAVEPAPRADTRVDPDSVRVVVAVASARD